MKNNKSNQKTTITENNEQWSVEFQNNKKVASITVGNDGTLNITADTIRVS